MEMTADTLPNDPQELKEIIFELQRKNDFLLEQFNLARSKRFAASSEISPNQIQLFNEAESESEVEAEDAPVSEVTPHSRKKPVRTSLPKDLPRETRVIDLDDSEKVCDCCQGPLHEMGRETKEQLEFIPAQIKVIETVRPKYSCRSCESDATQASIKIAPVPVSPIPKSIATPSLLAQIIINKYQVCFAALPAGVFVQKSQH